MLLLGAYMPARTLLIQAASITHEIGVAYDEALILADLVRLHGSIGAGAHT
jgi:hypothetical protein